MNRRLLVTLAIFGALVLLLAVGLTRDPREVPSPLIGKAAPAFSLPLLHEPGKVFSSKEQLGKVWIFNVWASWCEACRDEHPVILEFAKSGVVPVYGLDYKDKREDGLRWLARYGDPYLASFFDAEGKVGIDYGVYGVPETYVIDKKGIIRFKQIGAVTPEVLAKKIKPLVEDLKRE
ncbi:MAG: DsbE family thiol:disulfide interchange protein [Betaproteobacteria bacterium]|nr:DsbE family thiol:disulfide interchange protein [Betaproteobacteria bacterium]